MQNNAPAQTAPLVPDHEKIGTRELPSDGTVQCIKSPEQLRRYSAHIEDLAARALVPNILLETAFLQAAWEHFFNSDPSARVIMVWDQTSRSEPDGRVIGLLPLVSDIRIWCGVPLAVCFRNDMKFCGVPLLDKKKAGAALDQMLAAISETTPYPSAVLFDEIPAEGAFADALSAALARSQWSSRSYEKSPRVMLDATRSSEDYLAEALSRKKRKEYRRLTNRLKDMGDLQFDIVRDADKIETALHDFLRLEKEGWKGANQTAIRDRDDWRGYFADGVSEAARAGQAEIARLSLDGAAIAAGLVLTSGETAWFYKIAYEESLSQFSPGVLLTLELTKYLCDRTDIRAVDSCTRDDHPMISHIWRERCDFHDLLIAPPGSPAGIIFSAETVRRDARNILKKGYHKMKRNLGG